MCAESFQTKFTKYKRNHNYKTAIIIPSCKMNGDINDKN